MDQGVEEGVISAEGRKRWTWDDVTSGEITLEVTVMSEDCPTPFSLFQSPPQSVRIRVPT